MRRLTRLVALLALVVTAAAHAVAFAQKGDCVEPDVADLGGSTEATCPEAAQMERFSPPRFIQLLPLRVLEADMLNNREANERCAAEVGYERLRKEYEVAEQRFFSGERTEKDRLARNAAGDAFGQAQIAFNQCRESDPYVMTWQLRAFSEPSTSSHLVGVIRGSVGSAGVSFSVELTGMATPIPFHVDDFHYDSYYHTALARRGEWVQLPRRPFPAPVWVNAKLDVQESAELRPVVGDKGIFAFTKPVQVTDARTGQTMRLADERGRHFVFLETRGGQVLLRDEVPSDMACGEDFSPEVAAQQRDGARHYLVPLSDLVDADEHLLLAKRGGCC